MLSSGERSVVSGVGGIVGVGVSRGGIVGGKEGGMREMRMMVGRMGRSTI